MNNIIQKGGFNQKEVTKQLLSMFITDSGLNTANTAYLTEFWQTMFIPTHNTDFIPNNVLFDVGIGLGQLDISAFYSGFNNAFIYLYYQLHNVENKKTDIRTELHNTPLILVDGLNIVRNNDILLGFLPQIENIDGKLAQHVLLLINDNLIASTKAARRTTPPSFYDNLKIVLDNFLPILLTTINIPQQHFEKVNMIVLQHDSALLKEHQQAMTTKYTFINKRNIYIDFLQISKVDENGLDLGSFYKSPPGVKPMLFEFMKQIVAPGLVYIKPAGYTEALSDPLLKVTPLSVIPDIKTKFEGDDVALVLIGCFYKDIIKHKNVSIFSGDNYKWFNKRDVIEDRLLLINTKELEQNQDQDNIMFINIDTIENKYTNLQKKIYQLSDNKIQHIKTCVAKILQEGIMFEDYTLAQKNDCKSMIEVYLNKDINFHIHINIQNQHNNRKKGIWSNGSIDRSNPDQDELRRWTGKTTGLNSWRTAWPALPAEPVAPVQEAYQQAQEAYQQVQEAYQQAALEAQHQAALEAQHQAALEAQQKEYIAYRQAALEAQHQEYIAYQQAQEAYQQALQEAYNVPMGKGALYGENCPLLDMDREKPLDWMGRATITDSRIGSNPFNQQNGGLKSNLYFKEKYIKYKNKYLLLKNNIFD